MIFAYAGTARDEVMVFILSKEFVSSNKNAENKLCQRAAEVYVKNLLFHSSTCTFLALK